MKDKNIVLVQDRRGMYWDLLLYVPTVAALLSISAKLWYAGNDNLAYLLLFLGTFFFIAGANRILKTRMMLLSTAPIAIEVNNRQSVVLTLRNGSKLKLESDLRFYPDYTGRSFGLAGLDQSGRRVQFVFHRGQFPAEQSFNEVRDTFRASAQ